MHDPKRRDSQDSEVHGHRPAEVPIEDQAQATAQLAAIGGEPLEGSGFEEEELEKEFL
jgi:hypothetical protein